MTFSREIVISISLSDQSSLMDQEPNRLSPVTSNRLTGSWGCGLGMVRVFQIPNNAALKSAVTTEKAKKGKRFVPPPESTHPMEWTWVSCSVLVTGVVALHIFRCWKLHLPRTAYSAQIRPSGPIFWKWALPKTYQIISAKPMGSKNLSPTDERLIWTV